MEKGEAVIADMGAKAVPAFVPRARIVNRDPGRGGEACAQHLLGFGKKDILLVAEQAHDLPFGDIDAQVSQQPCKRGIVTCPW